MQKPALQRILIKGGVLSPNELKQIIDLAEAIGLDHIYFGSRQDILMPHVVEQEKEMEHFQHLSIETIQEKKYQNIVCSYVATDILPTTPWVSSATYLYILEQFRNKGVLEVNVTDPRQRMVPLFTGHLNFIASAQEDYWYLYIKLPHWEEHELYPVLIYTWDIGKVAAMIEQHCLEVTGTDTIFETLNNLIDTSNNRTIQKDLELPFVMFPYYEGMNKMDNDNYWLGLYWRNNKYDLTFLKAMTDLCLECRIGKICITPWKSFIIKGIHKKHKLTWEKLLGRFGINVRHSLLELNWHLPVANEEALELKKFIVRNFDQNDISTYGLTFGVYGSYGKYFTSIVIEKNPLPRTVSNFSVRPTYNVLYAKKFDPNTLAYITYAQDVDKIELPSLLMELSRLYFEQLGEDMDTTTISKPETTTTIAKEVYQCSDCMTIYDESLEGGILFEQLTEDYLCSVCDANREHFVKTQIHQNIVSST